MALPTYDAGCFLIYIEEAHICANGGGGLPLLYEHIY